MCDARRELKMTEDNMLFVEDISRLFHISPNTLRRKAWRQRWGIPLKRVGKKLCGLRPEIERWFRGLNG
jgi:hypothetical protein